MNILIDQGGGALALSDTLSGERFRLARERIGMMESEEIVHPACVPYFHAAAAWIRLLLDHRRMLEDGSFEILPVSDLQDRNRALYEDILPDNYGGSWANPGFAMEQLGRDTGRLLSALFYELRCMTAPVYEGDGERVLIRMELLLEIYFSFVTAWDAYRRDPDDISVNGKGKGTPGMPPASDTRDRIRQFLEDYAEDETHVRVRRSFIGGSLPERIIDSYGSRRDMRWLYRYGAYVSDNETGTFSYLESLPEGTIARMAETWTEGFRIGFEVTGKDLSIRRRAGLFYHIGFERVAARAAENLRRMGLEPVIPGRQENLFTQHTGRGGGGITTTSPNPQYAYDHREDLALFWNDVLRSRRMQALQQAYHREAETALYAGPVVMETFGERPFSPVIHRDYPHFTGAQLGKVAQFRREADLLYDRAVIGRERSFTIIAFPLPEITRGYAGGDLKASYEEIFQAVTDLNTLDYVTYRDVQARMIDVLNTARYIRVLGAGDNRTDLTVALQQPSDPGRQTIFENCVADVNIPVGEVFTTPELDGTNGILHVTKVYLNGLLFEDLEIRFEEGMTADYRCGGFPSEKEGRQYIEENILFHHESLPMGECAVGTNTTACAEAARLGFAERLPILIAEKTGPHFAVGDTCYSHEEDNRVYNPDGREIFAKENRFSLLRDSDPDRAYFGCHTDITIPYEEVGLLAAVLPDGSQVPLIENGRFVLPGTEFLNTPLLEA